jgi:hypothetical protein
MSDDYVIEGVTKKDKKIDASSKYWPTYEHR